MTRSIVVTGATSGLGRDIALRFAACGDSVFALARNAERLKELELEAGKNLVGVSVDVTKRDEVARAFRRVAKLAPTINVLVNNAAVFKMAPFADFTFDDIDAIIDTNLKGTIYCTHQALPLLTRGSRIIDISSVSGTHGIGGQAAYSASKFGLEGFADSLGQELMSDGINITTICPGGIATPLWNEGNPYPGDVSQLLRAADVTDLVMYVAALPQHVVMKRAVLFPSNEWH